jgi:hypothetical protein
LVKGYRRVPAPPPRIIAKTFFTGDDLSTADHSQSSLGWSGTYGKILLNEIIVREEKILSK